MSDMHVCPGCGLEYAGDVLMQLRAERDALRDKALRFDLDAAGIEQREREAVELVELRAERDALRELLREVVQVPSRLKIPRGCSPLTDDFLNRIDAALANEGSNESA